VAAKWLAEVNSVGQELRDKKLKQTEWQTQIESLFTKIELPELLKFIDFEKLTADLKHRSKGEKSLRMKFPEVEGLPTNLVFGHQLFALRKDRSVVPHGHDNMATAFLVLKGDFAGKHYDRMRDGKDHMIIKPTIDGRFKAGGCTTISDHKDNIHWFKCASDVGFIFNIHVLNLVAGKRSGRVYVDPKGEKIGGGLLKARKLKTQEAYDLYG
jgi:hypothetical protein